METNVFCLAIKTFIIILNETNLKLRLSAVQAKYSHAVISVVFEENNLVVWEKNLIKFEKYLTKGQGKYVNNI